MKKMNFFGVIALVAIVSIFMIGCAEKGGTFIIKNNTDSTIIGNVYTKGTSSIPTPKNISPGENGTWDFSNDVTVVWLWTGSGTGANGEEEINGGKTVTKTATAP